MTPRINLYLRLILLFTFILSALPMCQAVEKNLLINPGFEDGNTNGWTTWGGTLQIANSPVHSGNATALITNRTQTWQGPLQSILGLLQNNQTYTLSAWVRLQNADSADIGITIQQTDSAGTQYTRVYWDIARSDGWTQLIGEFTLETTGSLRDLNVYIEGPDPGVNFYVDDAAIVDLSSDWRIQAQERIEQIRKRDVELTVLSPTGEPLSDVTVNIQQTHHDFAFGSVINYRVLSNANYANFFKDHFEWAVMENESKWYSNEPSQGQERYATADGIYDFCHENGILMRGHTLYWAVDRWVQNWIQALPYAPLPEESELWDAVANRMNSAVTHFKDKFLHWDINNEMIAGSFFKDRLGDSVRLWMFEEAHRLDPNALLFINEYNVINGGWSLNQYKALAQELLDSNAPLSGLGVQCHMSGGFNRTDVLHRFDSVAEVGLPIWVTEFDVSQPDENDRADDLEDFYLIAFSQPAVEGILMWGFWENSHWRDDCYLVNADWTLNEAGRRYEQLMREWTTRFRGITDPNGMIEFRGFHGNYELTLTYEDAEPTITSIYLLPGDDPAEFVVTLESTEPADPRSNR